MAVSADAAIVVVACVVIAIITLTIVTLAVAALAVVTPAIIIHAVAPSVIVTPAVVAPVIVIHAVASSVMVTPAVVAPVIVIHIVASSMTFGRVIAARGDIQYLTGVNIVGIVQIIYSSNLVWVGVIIPANTIQSIPIVNFVVRAILFISGAVLATISTGGDIQYLAGIDMIGVIQPIHFGNVIRIGMIVTGNTVQGITIVNLVVRATRCRGDGNNA
jgi:hypothetical protein